jgi:trk system potassium uptake protein TrkA
VIAKANQEIQADLLMRIGADEVVYPEKEIAEKLAIRYNSNNIFDYIQLTADYSIYEIPIMGSWEGKTILEVDVRKKHHVNIIAVKSEKKGMNPMPGADYVFQKDDHVVVMGKSTDVFKVAGKRKR